MKRFFIFLSLYTAASALSWSFYYQLWQLTRPLDYAITATIHFLLGPLWDIGFYPDNLHNPGILYVWGIKTVILILFVAMACFRPRVGNRVFWWWMVAGFWSLVGILNVLTPLYG
jgi:hypothetical protein